MTAMRYKILYWLTATAITAVVLFPIYFMFISSLRSGAEQFQVAYFPSVLRLENYSRLLTDKDFLGALANSIVVSTSVALVTVMVSILAGYAIARISFTGRALVSGCLLAISMFPQVAALPGLFNTIQGLGLYNSVGALIFSHLMLTVPFTVWVFAAFIREIPVDLDESAMMDGAGRLRTLFRIIVPILMPAIATTFVLAFIISWNEFLYALTFSLTPVSRTVPVAISLLSGTTPREVPFGAINAASVIITVPLVIVAFIFQKRLVSGLSAGAIKG
ncbi:carbohydrate ABC transporter permease [Mesorhizobium sophorae]|uniref:carbohydrate ABC transporter permease n=1 Tax=Mesorhizobium sophorae TaxID=1300294 RepID=UPI000BA42977|nr:carbohydrate ABC transporter permease [Mesorhizobium sophorae]